MSPNSRHDILAIYPPDIDDIALIAGISPEYHIIQKYELVVAGMNSQHISPTAPAITLAKLGPGLSGQQIPGAIQN
jgi:hypothetical protein